MGCVARNLELWVERCIQYLKANLKFRITSCPERLLVNDYIMDIALDKWARHPEMLSVDHWCPCFRSLPLRGMEEDMDNEGDEDNRQLIGMGN